MNKFRINLVPKETEVIIKKKGAFKYFNFHSTNGKRSFNSLVNALESIQNVEKDQNHEGIDSTNQNCYYLLKTRGGVIKFEINYGHKIIKESNHPSTISIETDPYVPDKFFLIRIKEVIRLLVSKTEFKIFFWDAARFVTIDELYDREGPTTK